MNQKEFDEKFNKMLAEKDEAKAFGMFLELLFGGNDAKKNTSEPKKDNEPKKKTEPEEVAPEEINELYALKMALDLPENALVVKRGMTFAEMFASMNDEENPANVFGREAWFNLDDDGDIRSWSGIVGVDYPELSIREIDENLMPSERHYIPSNEDLFADDWFAIVRKGRTLN